MESSYLSQDVTLLLKDITGLVEPLPTAARERKIQQGAHYSAMLPLEYIPSPLYLRVYENALADYAVHTARAVAAAAEKILLRRGPAVALVSLARAGTPAGILLKRYLRARHGLDAPHYSISIIRGRGLDDNAMRYILRRHQAAELQFVDGWTGKGAILRELEAQIRRYPGAAPELAVLADPAGITDLCGTYDDFLIPSSCLNATVSGLISRTFLRGDLIGPDDFHGAAYYREWKAADRTYEFIRAVERCFDGAGPRRAAPEARPAVTGLEEVAAIARRFAVRDVNLIKPGIGETTRVLLRRVPHAVLVSGRGDEGYLRPIFQLAAEKNVPVIEYPLRRYRACGIIQSLAADA